MQFKDAFMLAEKPDLTDVSGFAYPNPLQPVQPMLPHDWQTGFPDPASPLMAQLTTLNHLFLFVGGGVFIFVCLLLLWVLVRYSCRWHPVARGAKDSPLLQVAFAIMPSVLLVLMTIPALRLIWAEAMPPRADMTVSVIGKAGGWTYDYLENGDFRFDSQLLDAATARRYGQPYLFAADSPLVVPVGRVVALQVTGADMVHVWSAPALGISVSAVPGRINTVWFKPMREGLYYALCSEFCGASRGGMPVAVKVVSDAEYRGWLSWAYQRYNDSAIAARPQ